MALSDKEKQYLRDALKGTHNASGAKPTASNYKGYTGNLSQDEVNKVAAALKNTGTTTNRGTGAASFTAPRNPASAGVMVGADAPEGYNDRLKYDVRLAEQQMAAGNDYLSNVNDITNRMNRISSKPQEQLTQGDVNWYNSALDWYQNGGQDDVNAAVSALNEQADKRNRLALSEAALDINAHALDPYRQDITDEQARQARIEAAYAGYTGPAAGESWDDYYAAVKGRNELLSNAQKRIANAEAAYQQASQEMTPLVTEMEFDQTPLLKAQFGSYENYLQGNSAEDTTDYVAAQSDRIAELEKRSSDLEKAINATGTGVSTAEFTAQKHSLIQQKEAVDAELERLRTSYFYTSNALAWRNIGNDQQMRNLISDYQVSGRFADMIKFILADPYSAESKRYQQYIASYWGVSLPDNATPQERDNYINQLQQLQGEIEAQNALQEAELKKAGYNPRQMLAYQQKQAAQRQARLRQAQYERMAEAHPVASSIGTAVLSPFQGVDFLRYAANTLNNKANVEGYIPTGSEDMEFTNYITAVRNSVSEKLAEKTNWKIFGQNVAAFLYQTGMSRIDSLVNMGVGGAFLGGKGLTDLIMGMSAAANKAKDIADNGGSNRQAFWGGLASGFAEAFFEEFSIEQLLKAKNITGVKELIKTFAAQAGVEASEEIFTEIANIISDAIILRDQSDAAQRIAAYKNMGEDDEHAKLHSFLDDIQQVALAGAGGLLAGIGAGGTAAAGNYASNINTGRNVGSFDVQRAIDIGLALDKDSADYRLAERLQEKLAEGKELTEGERGGLYRIMANEQNEQRYKEWEAKQRRSMGGYTYEQRADTMPVEQYQDEQNISAVLRGNGMAAETAETVSRAVAAAINGETLTKEQADAVNGNAIAKGLFASMTGMTLNEDGTTTRKSNVSLKTRRNNGKIRLSLEQRVQNRGELLEAAARQFGEAGLQSVADNFIADSDVSAADFFDAFSAYYIAGHGNVGIGNTKLDSNLRGVLTEAQQKAAYEAGRSDAQTALANNKETAEKAKSAGENSGIHQDHYSAAVKQWGIETAQKVDAWARALGVRVTLAEQVEGGKANAQIRGTGVSVQADSRGFVIPYAVKDPVAFVLGHEFTHRMQDVAPEAYWQFVEAVSPLIQDNVQGIVDTYTKAGQSINYSGALDEAVADYAGKLIADNDLLDRFIEEHKDNRTFLQKVRDVFRAILDKLTGKNRETKEAQQLQNAIDKLEAAYKAATERAKTLSVRETAGEARESAKYWYPPLNDSQWNLLNLTLEKELETSKNFLDEATKWLYATRKGTKVFAVYGIGDGTKATVLYASGGSVAERDYNKLQKRLEGKENGTKRSRAALDRLLGDIESRRTGQDTVISGNGYGRSNAEAMPLSQRERGSNRRRNTGKGTENSGGVTGRFSLKAPVEETDRLIAWHNIRSSAIDDAIELGGLAMPSFAVKPADQSHDSYGDISIIARKDSIDPQRSRDQRIFAGDAWTPVFPEIGIKISYDAAEAAENKVRALLDAAGMDGYSLALDTDNLADQIKRYGSFEKAYGNKREFKIAFLKDTGRTIVIPKQEMVYTNRADIPTLRKIAKAIDLEKAWTGGGDKMQYEPVVRRFLREYAVKHYGPEIADKLRPAGKELSFSDVDNVIHAAWKLQRTGVTKQTDTAKLDKRLEYAMRGKNVQAEYEAWLKDLSRDFIERRGVRNNKELFTPSGSRRGFDALYDEYNLANIVRAMKVQPQQGRTQFLSGPGSVKGAALEDFSSIEQVREARGRLVQELDEAGKKAYDDFNDAVKAIADRIADDPFTGSEMLADILSSAKTKPAIERYLRREYDFLRTQDGLDLSRLAGDIQALVQQANTLPQEYFEAKAYRAFPFSEAAGVVVPDTLPQETQQKLRDLGANVVTYKAGDNADRLSKVNSVEGARFSLKARDTDYMAAVERGEDWKVEHMVRDAATAWGAAQNDNGRPLDLYHGTPRFGFTRFDNGTVGDTAGLIYTSTRREVAANYAGRDHYAGTRPIGKKFIENATRIKDIIQNAKTVYESNYSVMTDKQRAERMQEIERATSEIADRFNALPDHSKLFQWDDDDYTFNNALSMVEDPFFLIQGRNYEGYTDEEIYGYLASDLERFEQNLETVRNYLSEHRKEILDAGMKEAYQLFTGYDLFDAYVDISHTYMKLLSGEEVIVNEGGNVNYPGELQKAMDAVHNIGAYHLYGNLGARPLIIDAEQRDWLTIKAPEVMGDDKWHSTDRIAQAARTKGYTSVVIKNVYDGGIMGDDYIFFGSDQVKSADPVTYDDAGNVIPLSERFNREDEDIRYSIKDIIGDSGKNYGKGVYLDSTLLENLTEDERKQMVAERVKELAGNTFIAYDKVGNPVEIEIAAANKRFKNEKGKSVAVNRDLVTKKRNSHIKQEAVVLADELISAAKYSGKNAAKHSHDWLDNYGANPWDKWTVYVQEKNNSVWEATIHIANTKNGEKILYDIDPIKMVEQRGNSRTSTTDSHDTTNPADVKTEPRSSLKSSMEGREIVQLRRQVERLQEQVDYWKGQTKRTDRAAIDSKAVEKTLKDLAREYTAKLTTEETAALTAKLQSLYDYISHGGEGSDELTFTDAYARAHDIADELIENAVAVDDQLKQTYSDLLSYIKAQRFVIAARDSHDIADFNEWRKTLKGKMNVTMGEKGNIDTIYSEMAQRWPEWFDAEGAMHPADQLMTILDTLEMLSAVEEYNPFDANMEDAKTFAANEIMERFFDAPQVAKTFADRQAEKLATAKAKGAQRVAALREQKNEQIAKLRRANAEHVKERVAAVRAQKNDQINRILEHNRQMRENASARRSDSEARSRLLRIVRRLQNKKMPAVNRARLQEIIGDIDTIAKGMTGKTIEKLSDLREWYDDRRKNDPDFIADPRIEDAIARLSKRHISELSAQEVADLTEVLLNIENELRTEHQLIDEQDRRDTFQQGEQIINDVYATRGSKGGFWNTNIVTETLSPTREIRRLTGYVDNDPLYRAVQSLQQGELKMLDYQRRAGEAFLKFANDKAFSKFFSGKEADGIKIAGLGPKGPVTVTITPAMRTALYLHSLNDQNLRHIRDGGITVPDFKLYQQGKISEAYDRGTTIRLTPSQVRSITAKMTAKERAFAQASHNYFNGQSRSEINETSEKLKGYSVAGVENYFPINTDRNFSKTDFESIKYDGSIEGMGFLKERVNAANPIYLRDANDVLSRSIQQHSQYVGMAIPVRNFNKLLGVNKLSFNEDGSRNGYDSSVQQAIRKQWGGAGYDYIEQLMSDIQNGHSKVDSWDSLFRKLRGSYAKAVLTLNASVALKQAASYPTAAAVLGWEPLMKAMKDFGKVDLDLIAKYTPLQWYRSQGFSTKELGDLKKNDRQLPEVLNWVQGVDLLTTRKLWKASEYYVRQHNKGLSVGSDAFYRAVAEVYNRVILDTQPNYTTMERPQMLRSNNSLIQNLAMFKTQPFQNFNILYDAAANLEAKKRQGDTAAIKEARRGFTNAVTSQLAQLAVFASMTMLWSMFRGKGDKYKDEEKDEYTLSSVLKALGKDMVGGLFSGVPFGSDVWELASSKLFGDKYYGLDVVSVSALADTVSSVEGLTSLFSDTFKTVIAGEDVDWNNVRLKADGYFKDLSKTLGVPYENVVNLFNAVYRNAQIKANGPYVGGYQTLKLTTDPSSGKTKYMDVLYGAYVNNREAFQTIYDDMIAESLYSEDAIKSAMETRMKKAQGVEHVSDLSTPYLPAPETRVRWDNITDALEAAPLWNKATKEQQDAVNNLVYQLISGSGSGDDMQAKIDHGASVGLDDTEYIMFRLALDMADQEKHGSVTNDEYIAALDMLTELSSDEKGYLWSITHTSDKNNPYSSSKASTAAREYKDEKAAAKEEKAKADIANVSGSSAISAASYNPVTGIATVTWKSSGKTYTYPVSQAEWDAFKSADSKGKFINQNWKQ